MAVLIATGAYQAVGSVSHSAMIRPARSPVRPPSTGEPNYGFALERWADASARVSTASNMKLSQVPLH